MESSVGWVGGLRYFLVWRRFYELNYAWVFKKVNNRSARPEVPRLLWNLESYCRFKISVYLLLLHPVTWCYPVSDYITHDF